MAYAPEDPNAKWMRELNYGLETGYGVGSAGSLGNQMHEMINRPLSAPPVPVRSDDFAPPAVSPFPTDGSLSRAPRRGGGHAIGPGLADELARFAEWIEQHCPPLRGAHGLGRWLTARRWPWRLPPAALGAVLLFAMLDMRILWPMFGVSASAGIASLTAAHAWWLGTAAGGWLGWKAVSIVGAVVMLSARLVALALALTSIAVVLAAIYSAFALFFGWPMPF